jgi:hypothetical protein
VTGKMKNTKKEQKAEEARKEGEEDMPQVLLTTMHELADFHERINKYVVFSKNRSNTQLIMSFYSQPIPVAKAKCISLLCLGTLFYSHNRMLL